MLDPKVPTIQPIDDSEGTIYVLRRDGQPDVYAHWPQALLNIEPKAKMISAYGSEVGCIW